MLLSLCVCSSWFLVLSHMVCVCFSRACPPRVLSMIMFEYFLLIVYPCNSRIPNISLFLVVRRASVCSCLSLALSVSYYGLLVLVGLGVLLSSPLVSLVLLLVFLLSLFFVMSLSVSFRSHPFDDLNSTNSNCCCRKNSSRRVFSIFCPSARRICPGVLFHISQDRSGVGVLGRHVKLRRHRGQTRSDEVDCFFHAVEFRCFDYSLGCSPSMQHSL